ncbi:MAG: Flp pilus assembly complex ATPase component TadA [Planctomycetes bacterium]|nr:Flp pilus assembly complex ATPase component TadA [Planctomycetota bacterium]MCB9868488.1 Flp pilus assembly complex ATPase component TadA [Planctomycetota bacterium]
MIQFAKKVRSILVKTGKLSDSDADALLEEALRTQTSLTDLLTKKGVLSEDELVALIGRAANIPPISLGRLKHNPDVLESVPVDVARDYHIFPIDRIGNILTIAIANPFDVLKLDDIRIITGCQLRPVISTVESIDRMIGQGYRSDEESVGDILNSFDDVDLELKDASDTGDDGMDLSAISDEASPVVKMVNKIIVDAVQSGVSDIHIEPFEKRVLVRYRKDGRMNEVMALPKRMQNSVTSRIKIMSKLDIAERNRPQDGKFQMKLGNKAIDFRVSILPVVWGEKTVFRILDSTNLAGDIRTLGFEQKCLDDYLWACSAPYGMILVTGPTGSGKSTTLYSAVRHIADPEINLVTVEDPVEYTLEGINQVPVNPKRGLTFAGALRSILRQDPDVVLLGEIRDKETLEIAVKAALTGHLVLSTLHTNDAPSTITRMIDMGMDPFMVSSSTLLICAQRLGRTLCAHCKKPTDANEEALLRVGFTKEQMSAEDFGVYDAVGCSRCTNGYKGRFAILETMRMTESIRRMVVERAHLADIKKKAIEEGMITLRIAGLANVARGKTSIQEVLRVTMED